MADTRYAGYPSAQVYREPDGKDPVQHLLWGDWLSVKGPRQDGYAEVRARGVDGWMREADIQSERLLEVVFVDIGQGDGALLVTPDDKKYLIDAGQNDNMQRFLSWRFSKFQKKVTFEAAIITHPDQDHYFGFDRLFSQDNVHFKTVYHNGIMERAGAGAPLGPRTKAGNGKPSLLTDLVRTDEDLASFLARGSDWQGKKYPTMIAAGLARNSFDSFRMLSADDGHLPGHGPGKPVVVEVLGPVTEEVADGEPGLRWLVDAGKTKNGHSVVLKVTYRNVRILLGGDLNIPAEHHLLAAHTGLQIPPKTLEDQDTLIEAARRVFEVDIAKACHHGSADFTDLYLESVNPIATVISSGDDEPHAHPRAETLGAIGRASRGRRPLIFSTELSRSGKELIKRPFALQRELKSLSKQIDEAPEETAKDKKKKAKLQKEFDKLVEGIERSVAIYGAIQLRTDGDKVVLAYRMERESKRGGKLIKWDIYTLEPEGPGGPLRFRSKHL